VGNEDQNPNIKGVLDQVIAQIEARIAQQGQSGGQQQQAAAPVSQGEANRQELSGAAGGI
jgi:hypothetical protein